MADSLRDLAHLSSTSTISSRHESGEPSSPAASYGPSASRSLAPGGAPPSPSSYGNSDSDLTARDDDSIWNWNNDVEKERLGPGGEVMFDRPSDISAIDTDEEEALERRRAYVIDACEDEGSESEQRDVYTLEEVRRLVRKLDLRLTLFMAVLQMLLVSDQSANGYARIAGLETDLRLTPSNYEWALTAFCLAYLACIWVPFLLHKSYPAHIYLSSSVFACGLLASLQSVVTNLAGLVVLRALVGVAQAVFGIGLPLFLSLFYTRTELAVRVGLITSAAPFANSTVAGLSWLVTVATARVQGLLAPWRTLFLIQGFPSILIAVFVWKYVPDRPAHVYYLSPRERKVARLRIKQEHRSCKASRSGKGQGRDTKKWLSWKDFMLTLQTPRAWLIAFAALACNVVITSLSVFLPTCFHDMGFTISQSHLLSAPPYIVAFLVALITAYQFEKALHRCCCLLMVHALSSGAAYAVISVVAHFRSSLHARLASFIRYAAVFPAAWGAFSLLSLLATLAVDDDEQSLLNGTGGARLAFICFVAQFGPLIGVWLFPQGQGPWYTVGVSTCAGCMFGAGMLAVMLWILAKREVRKTVMRKGDGMELEMMAVEARGLMREEAE